MNSPELRKSFANMHDHKFLLKPSKYYSIFLAIALLASVIVVVTIKANIWIKLLVLALLAFYGSYTFLRYALLKTRDSILALQLVSGNEWQVTTRAGVQSMEVQGDSTITPWLSVLRFKVSGKRSALSCIVLKDSLPDEEYRQLVAILRMHD